MVSASDFTPTCNTTVVDMCTPSTCCLAQGIVTYLPTVAGNAFYLACFALLLLAQAGLMIKHRVWSFGIWFCIGLIGEIVGYTGRIMLHQDIFSFNAFLVYLVPITIAPAFITASIYLCLARIILILDPALTATRLKPMMYTKIFVVADFIALVLQGMGGGIAATSDTNRTLGDIGVNIMIAGLAWQVASLTAFITLCADFVRRLTKRPPIYTHTDGRTARVRNSRLFKFFVYALAAAVALILVRSCYRVAELREGFSGSLANNEVLFMIFEAPMIILAVLGLTIFHPGLCLGGMWKRASMTRAEPDLAGTRREGGPKDLAEEFKTSPLVT